MKLSTLTDDQLQIHMHMSQSPNGGDAQQFTQTLQLD